MAKKQNKTRSQRMKSKARKSLKKDKISKKKKNYVVDTSAIINQFLPKLIKQGMKGKIIIPNAVMAELEKLANQNKEVGFTGLEEITNLRKSDKVKVKFKGERPTKKQITYAKSGEIDAMIRKMANNKDATLITTDLVQAKSAQAYGVDVLFLKLEQDKGKTKKKKKKGFIERLFKN